MGAGFTQVKRPTGGLRGLSLSLISNEGALGQARWKEDRPTFSVDSTLFRAQALLPPSPSNPETPLVSPANSSPTPSRPRRVTMGGAGGGALELPLPCFHSSPPSASASPPLPATGGAPEPPRVLGGQPLSTGPAAASPLASLPGCVCVCVCVYLFIIILEILGESSGLRWPHRACCLQSMQEWLTGSWRSRRHGALAPPTPPLLQLRTVKPKAKTWSGADTGLLEP